MNWFGRVSRATIPPPHAERVAAVMRQAEVPDLTTKQLLALVTLAEHESFTTAAAALEVSQPTLSRAVQRLEKQLGLTLFARSTRRLEITPDGREIVAVAERILNDLELALASRGERGADRRGQVIVSTQPAFAQDAMPRIVRQLRERWRNVVVHVRHGNAEQVIDDVSHGIADVGVGFVTNPPEIVECVVMRPDPLVAVLPWGHKLSSAKGAAIRLEELRDEAVIALDRASHIQRIVDGATARLGFTLHEAVVTPSAEDVMQLVRAGAGCAILPASVLPKRRDFAVRPLKKPSLSMVIAAMRLRGRPLTPSSERLFSLCVEYLKPLSGGKVRASRERIA